MTMMQDVRSAGGSGADCEDLLNDPQLKHRQHYRC